jgi:hypothetical protein
MEVVKGVRPPPSKKTTINMFQEDMKPDKTHAKDELWARKSNPDFFKRYNHFLKKDKDMLVKRKLGQALLNKMVMQQIK